MRFYRHLRVVWLLLSLVILAGLGLQPASVSAHSRLIRSDPPGGSIQPSSPRAVNLWFSEAIDPAQSSVQVFDEQRQRVDADDSHGDPADDGHLSASLKDLIDGTYTVAWRAKSIDDGHTVNGSFTFRVGQARMPGAATTESDRPGPGAVVLRWANLLGLSVVAGWFLLSALRLDDDRRRRRMALGAAGLALGADLLLVPLQAFFPGGNAPAQGIVEAARLMPSPWLVRLLLEVGLLALVGLYGRIPRSLAARAGAGLAAAAVITIPFVSHAAANERFHLAAMAANIVHVTSVTFWIGGVVQLALLPRGERLAPGPGRRFSALALLLAPVAVASGIAAAGVELPDIASLWQSDYGRVLIAKVLVVLVVLGLGWVNRTRIHTGIVRLLPAARALRAEAIFAVCAVLLASLLALSAPPTTASAEPLHLRTEASPGHFAHLEMPNPNAGNRRVDVWLTDEDNLPIAGVDRVTVTFSMLERPIDLPSTPAVKQPDGHWRVNNVPLTVKGWWQATLQFTKQGVTESATTYLLLPDPTFSKAELSRPADPAGRDLFKRAIARITELRSMRSDETLTDGIGNSVRTDYTWAAPDKLAYSTASGNESVAIGGVQYYREQGGPWSERKRVEPVSFPATIPAYYSGADGFTLGQTQELDGEQCQILSFYVPAIPGRDEAWYIWWVGTDTGLVRREAMVAYYHYMTNHYIDHDAPVSIEAPQVAGK